jgi:cytochrome c
VGNHWPHAPPLFDYIRRATPQNAPESLSSDDVCPLSAYILNLNGLLPADTTLDAKSLPAIKMPSHKIFVADPRLEKSGMHERLSSYWTLKSNLSL